MRTFASLRLHRNYRLFFTGQVFSVSGNHMQQIADAWLLLTLTGSALSIGILAVAQYLPFTLLGLFAGVIVDRVDPHKLVVANQCAMMALAGAAATLTLTGLIRPWHLFVFGAFGGLVRVLEGPARQTLVLQMVGRGELPNAVALTSSLMSAGRVIGPAIGGVVVAAVGVGYCYAINAVTFLPVLAALLLLRRSEFYPLKRFGRPALVRGIGEVVRHARATPTVLVVLASILLLSLFSANVNILVPTLATETAAGDAAVFGGLMSALGLGSVAGALFAATLGRASRRAFVVGGAGMGLAELLVAVRPSVASGAVLLFAAGVCYMLWTSNGASLLQLSAPDNLQGRVAGLYMFAFVGVSPFGGLLSGALAASGGVALAYGVGGAMGLCAGLSAAFVLRRLELGRPPRPQPIAGRA